MGPSRGPVDPHRSAPRDPGADLAPIGCAFGAFALVLGAVFVAVVGFAALVVLGLMAPGLGAH